jgi:starch phosphorylase
MRRYKKNHRSWSEFAAKNAIQMNDTHPALTVAELMRFFVDEERLPWGDGLGYHRQNLRLYQSHLAARGAGEMPVPLFEHVLPRHLKIIYDDQPAFPWDEVIRLYPNDEAACNACP